jgi:methyl-accepting chemotaxis protein
LSAPRSLAERMASRAWREKRPFEDRSLNIVRLFQRNPDADQARAPGDGDEFVELGATGPVAPTAAQIEPIIGQLEDDVRFTMRIIGYEADKARSKIEESVGHVSLIRSASEELSSLSSAANSVSAALALTNERLDAATQTIKRDVAGADLFISEAKAATAEVSASMARLTDAVGKIDSVMHIIATIARHTNVLALNAGIEAARAGPEGRNFGVLATEVKSLAVKAQKATSDITSQVSSLQNVARQNNAAVNRISQLMGRIEPVVSSIRNSVLSQTRETGEASARAAEGANFAQTVAAKARDVKQMADTANVASQQAKKAGDLVVFAMNRYAQRSTVYLRNSLSGDRRTETRHPVKIPGVLFINGGRMRLNVLDLSEGGALFMIEGRIPEKGDRGRLSLPSLGDCPGLVVATSDLGTHFRFDRPAPEVVERIRRLLASVGQSDAPFVEKAGKGAAEIATALEDGLSYGEVEIGDLITTDYRPIDGTDPVQHETPALAFYERVLPTIIMKYWESNPVPVFVVATDRNAYIPVHHPKYSLPQRPNEWAWNDLHARNKRIMERWQMLVISRNTEPCLVKVFLRHMNGGEIVPVKVFASPIYVQGRLWGNFQMSYYY